MKIRFALITLVMVVYLPACSFFSTESEQPPTPPTLEASVEAPAAPEVGAEVSNAAPPKNYIEILWAIPEEKVDAYLIRYGYARDRLEFERKLDVTRVETVEDSAHGFVYRHLLEDIAPNKKLYVSLISVRGDKQSEPSQVLEVEAGQ